ncbi:MAG: hypothetical protein M3Q10_16105 [Chloroflexota bacterium]|nr:hypothetical protein [Chloroflexota bacterium]
MVIAAEHVLGVDGGNTKTIALVAAADGTIHGAGRGGCGDIYAGGVTDSYGLGCPEQALAAIDAAVVAALVAAGTSADRLVAGAFSMAGADWPEDFAFLRSAMARRGYGRTVTVVNDAIGALRAGSPDGTGVVVACGTGVATGARAADGREWHSSFWQDPNGAHDLGWRALRAVFRAELGLDPPTSLTGRVLDYFGQGDVEGVLHLMTARGEATASAKTGGVARLLMDEAAAGDAVAAGIVAARGAALGEYAAVAARRVGIEQSAFPLVLTGGVFRHPAPQLAEAVVARLRAEAPGAKPLRSPFEPAVGAVFLALEAAGIRVDDAVRTRAAATAPAATLFET